MSKKLQGIVLSILVIFIAITPAFAESKSDKILRYLGKAGQTFLNSGNGFYMNGSMGIVPPNSGYSQMYPQQYNSPLQYFTPQQDYYNNYQQPGIMDTLGNLGLYNSYPVTNAINYDYSSRYPKYNIEPQRNIMRPTGQINIQNARKEDVLVLISELCAKNGWGIESPQNSSYYEHRRETPGAYKISFNGNYYYSNHNQRQLVLTINQTYNGTVITTFSSTFLVKEKVGEILAMLNSYYPVQTSQFE